MSARTRVRLIVGVSALVAAVVVAGVALIGRGDSSPDRKPPVLELSVLLADDAEAHALRSAERAYGSVRGRKIATTLSETGRGLIADPGRVRAPEFFTALHDVGLKHVGANVVSIPLNGRDHSITVHEIAR